MAYCFLDKDRKCTEECMAYTGEPYDEVCEAKPKCLLLETAGGLSDMLTGKTMTVKHPVSAPPPEITS